VEGIRGIINQVTIEHVKNPD